MSPHARRRHHRVVEKEACQCGHMEHGEDNKRKCLMVVRTVLSALIIFLDGIIIGLIIAKKS